MPLKGSKQARSTITKLRNRLAAIRQWKAKTAQQRKAHASMMAKAKHASMTPEQRSAFAKKMADARWAARERRAQEAEIRAAHEKGSEDGVDQWQDRD